MWRYITTLTAITPQPTVGPPAHKTVRPTIPLLVLSPIYSPKKISTMGLGERPEKSLPRGKPGAALYRQSRKQKGTPRDDELKVDIKAETYYGRFKELLPIDDFVPEDLDVEAILKTLFIFFSTSRFGDHPIGYTPLKNAAGGKRVRHDVFNQCLDWLIRIRVIVDIKGGLEIARKIRAKGQRRCAVNTNPKDAPYPGNEIIRLLLFAKKEMSKS